jgi:hypothetical protein
VHVSRAVPYVERMGLAEISLDRKVSLHNVTSHISARFSYVPRAAPYAGRLGPMDYLVSC